MPKHSDIKFCGGNSTNYRLHQKDLNILCYKELNNMQLLWLNTYVSVLKMGIIAKNKMKHNY